MFRKEQRRLNTKCIAYRISSKDVTMIVTAENTRDAFRKFMHKVCRTEEWRRLGLIAVINHEDEGQQVAMRTPTALVLLGKIDEEMALLSLQQVYDGATMTDLRKLVQEDRWVLS